jgi:hypothetical protein
MNSSHSLSASIDAIVLSLSSIILNLIYERISFSHRIRSRRRSSVIILASFVFLFGEPLCMAIAT